MGQGLGVSCYIVLSCHFFGSNTLPQQNGRFLVYRVLSRERQTSGSEAGGDIRVEWIPKPHLAWKHLEACLAPSRLRSQQVSEEGSFGGGGGEGVQ